MYTNLYINVYSIIHSNPKVRKIQLPVNWMAKQNIAQPQNGTLFGNKKEWNIDSYYNTDEPLKQHAKWKMPSTKDDILYDSPIK